MTERIAFELYDTNTVNLYQAIDSIKHQYGEQFLIRPAGFDGKRDDKQKVEEWLRQFK